VVEPAASAVGPAPASRDASSFVIFLISVIHGPAQAVPMGKATRYPRVPGLSGIKKAPPKRGQGVKGTKHVGIVNPTRRIIQTRMSELSPSSVNRSEKLGLSAGAHLDRNAGRPWLGSQSLLAPPQTAYARSTISANFLRA
jgi:hypothetical protein